MSDITISQKSTPKTGIFSNLGSKVSGLVPKIDWLALLKNTGVTLASMLVFLLIWHLGASYLYNIEATAKIEKARTEQG
ncbi:MAG: ABC transporter permease, partial [Bacteroidota bacterium]